MARHNVDTAALNSLVRRAKNSDVLADNLKPVIDSTAKLGSLELGILISTLNDRGIMMKTLRAYGYARRDFYARQEKLAPSPPKFRAYEFECLK